MATAEPIQKNNGKGATATAADVEEQFERLRADIAALSQTLSDFGSGKLEEIADRSAGLANDAKARLKTAEGDLEDRIRANPITSVGIAAGVGFLVALLTRR